MTYEELILKLKDRLAADGAYPIQAQAMLSTQILKDKLELVLPWAMEASGFDFWLVLSRENNDDPIHSTLVTWDMLEARRVSILAFHRDSKTGAVRRMCVGSQSPACMKMSSSAVRASGRRPHAFYGSATRPALPSTAALIPATVTA